MENKTLPVSIVIPAKNEEKCIKILLESIRMQTYQPKEIIVADAYSDDMTREIAKEFGAQIVDGGIIPVGRNKGFEKTTQDIVIFMDADVELLEDDVLKRIYDSFTSQDVDCATCKFRLSKRDKDFESRLNIILFNAIKDFSANAPFKFLKGDWGTFVMVKRDAYKQIGGFSEQLEYMEDGFFIQEMVKNGFKYTVLSEKVGVIVKSRSKKEKRRIFENIRITFGWFLGFLSLIFLNWESTRKLAYSLNQKATKLYGPMGGMVRYENPYRPNDRDSGFPKDTPRFWRRFYEMIPGALLWLLMLTPVIFALLKWDEAFVIYVAFLVAYWSLRTMKFLAGIFVGIRRMKRDIGTDWMKKINETNPDGFKELRYAYLCPVYGESMDVLGPTFEYWSKSDVGAEKIDVIMAIEERKKDLQIENFNKLKAKYGKKFGSMRYYVHPFGIEGEVAGVKGANINWSARKFVDEIEKEGKDISKYLLISCDSDLRPHPKYLSAITYKYLTADNPYDRYYATAVHTYNNNLWRVPSLIRAQSQMLTLVLLQNWVVDKLRRIPIIGESIYVRDSFSSYAVSLKTLKDIQFWDPEIANDDTAFYWNAMVRSKGTFKSEEVYVPTYNDAVENETYIKSHISYYKQQHRWGWGIINVPITLAAMFQKNNDFPWYRKLYLIKGIFEYQIWMLTVVFVLSFGLTIMGWLNPEYQYTVFSYNLPRILSYVFTAITLSNIPMIIFRRQLSPIPKGWKWWRHLIDIAETFLITVNMLTFGFIPIVQAQTEMMLGMAGFKRNFYITEKVKIKS